MNNTQKAVGRAIMIAGFLLSCGSATTVLAQDIKVALQSDTGDYLGRCNNCIPGAAYPDSAFVHVTEADLPNATWAHFTIERLNDGKYALQSDTGNYLGRCNGCIPGGAYPDSAFVHVTKAELPGAAWAHFTIERLKDGKYALQSDTGNYLGRCNGCIPGGAYPNSAFVHVTKTDLEGAEYAHWNMVFLP